MHHLHVVERVAVVARVFHHIRHNHAVGAVVRFHHSVVADQCERVLRAVVPYAEQRNHIGYCTGIRDAG